MNHTFESYIAACRPDQRGALDQLALRIEAMLPPDAQRVLSYAMPGWRIPVRGQAQTSTATPPATKVAAGIAAFKNHLGFYPHSGSIIPKLAADLNAEGFKTSKSGILFTPEHPIPDWALKEALRLRVEQIG